MKKAWLAVLAVLGCAAWAFAEPGRGWVQCKWCGHRAASAAGLTGSACQRHPDGSGAGRHALYEGGEKSEYTCKWCGHRAVDIGSLTSSKCMRHPKGPGAGRHEPSL